MLRLISELSDQDANRWVANKLEPFASLDMPRVIVTDEPKPSSLGFWLAVEVYDEGDIARWIPRDFVSDPAMWSMLLEQLLRNGASVSGAGAMTIGADWPEVAIDYGPTTEQSVTNARLGRAVVEAWMLSKGWTE